MPTASNVAAITCVPTANTSTPSRNAGCNTGGLGFTNEYVGASGTVPVGADPTDGERLTGKRALNIWAEVTHVNY